MGGRLSGPSSPARGALTTSGGRHREAGVGARRGRGWQGHEPQATAAFLVPFIHRADRWVQARDPMTLRPTLGTRAWELRTRGHSALCHAHAPPCRWGWREPPRERLGAPRVRGSVPDTGHRGRWAPAGRKGPKGLVWARRLVGRPRREPSHTCQPEEHGCYPHTHPPLARTRSHARTHTCLSQSRTRTEERGSPGRGWPDSRWASQGAGTAGQGPGGREGSVSPEPVPPPSRPPLAPEGRRGQAGAHLCGRQRCPGHQRSAASAAGSPYTAG